LNEFNTVKQNKRPTEEIKVKDPVTPQFKHEMQNSLVEEIMWNEKGIDWKYKNVNESYNNFEFK